MKNIAQRLATLDETVRGAERKYGRKPGAVQIVAVGKGHPAAVLREAAAGGLVDFAENYLQEAAEKMAALADLSLRWHFIGPVQSNKTRAIATGFQWLHSLDRLKIARRLSEQRPAELPPLNVCVQVNISGEKSKSGVSLEAVPELAAAVAALPGLRLRGLMTMPAPVQGLDTQRVPFRQLRECLDGLRGRGLDVDTLSMGTSTDLEAAIAEGATLVRIGTALFGPRIRAAASSE